MSAQKFEPAVNRTETSITRVSSVASACCSAPKPGATAETMAGAAAMATPVSVAIMMNRSVIRTPAPFQAAVSPSTSMHSVKCGMKPDRIGERSHAMMSVGTVNATR